MIKMDEAVSRAKNFLSTGGILATELEDVSPKDKKWVVILAGSRLFNPGQRFTVELDGETGDIVGFRKEQPGK